MLAATKIKIVEEKATVTTLLKIVSILILISSCVKDSELSDTYNYSIEGVVIDKGNNNPISNIDLSVDGTKSGSILNSVRINLGKTTCDNNGHFKLLFKEYTEAEIYEFTVNSSSTNSFVKQIFTINAELFKLTPNKSQNILLTAGTILQIKFKNQNPINDSDWFMFGYMADANGWFKINPIDENIGTVKSDNGIVWLGKDVNANRTIQTTADDWTYIYWEVEKSKMRTKYRDSIFCKRDTISTFKINY